MASQQADAELLQDALMLTSTGPIAGKLDMPGLQALSHTCKLFSAALKDAPTLFWQVRAHLASVLALSTAEPFGWPCRQRCSTLCTRTSACASSQAARLTEKSCG